MEELRKLRGNNNRTSSSSSSTSSSTGTGTIAGTGTSAGTTTGIVGTISKQPLDLRVLQAVATAYFGHAARRSANSDKIFHSVPLPLHDKSGQSQSQSQLLAVHPSSSLASSLTARDSMSMSWGTSSSFVPEYVVYQEAVQGSGRASMKHVSWVPTEVFTTH